MPFSCFIDHVQAVFDRGLSLQEGSREEQDSAVETMRRVAPKHKAELCPLGLYGWLQLLKDCRLLGGPIGGVTERDATTIFCWSRSVVVAESLSRSFVLQWVDFLEAFARLADLVRVIQRKYKVKWHWNGLNISDPSFHVHCHPLHNALTVPTDQPAST